MLACQTYLLRVSQVQVVKREDHRRQIVGVSLKCISNNGYLSREVRE